MQFTNIKKKKTEKKEGLETTKVPQIQKIHRKKLPIVDEKVLSADF